jgi:hypothetical protein
MEAGFIVVDEHRSGNVHRVDQTKPFHHAALMNEFFNLRRDVDEPASIRYLEPKMFSERFQWTDSLRKARRQEVRFKLFPRFLRS